MILVLISLRVCSELRLIIFEVRGQCFFLNKFIEIAQVFSKDVFSIEMHNCFVSFQIYFALHTYYNIYFLELTFRLCETQL